MYSPPRIVRTPPVVRRTSGWTAHGIGRLLDGARIPLRLACVGGDGPAVLGRLVDRYLGTRESAFARWLLARRPDEVAVRIRPAWMTSWDFTRRMGG